MVKHPKWRVPGLEVIIDHAPEVIDELDAKLRWMMSAFTEIPPYDPEGAGSYMWMGARPHSDLDINISFLDWKQQCIALNYAMRHPDEQREYHDRKKQISTDLGIFINVGWVDPDSRSYNQIFSFNERKWYNRKPYEFLDQHLKWDVATGRWKKEPRKEVRKIEWAEDPFANEQDEWRQRYGQHYIDFSPYITG